MAENTTSSPPHSSSATGNSNNTNNNNNDSTSLFFQTLPKNIQNLLNNLTTLVTVKLDDNNFTIWYYQIENALFSNQLMGFVDGSCPCPSAPSSSTNEWKLIDRNIVSSIIATLSPSLILHFLEHKTSMTLLKAISSRFAALSQSHIHELKKKLFKTTKEENMEAYIVKIKTISDSLAAAGAPVPESDLVFITLEGLNSDYSSFKTSIRLRDIPISFDSLCNLLKSEEIHITHDNKHSQSSDSTALHIAKNSSPFSPQQNPYTNLFQNPPYLNSIQFANQRGRGARSRGGRFRGGGRGRSPKPLYRFPCQHCGYNNHLTQDCYNKPDSSSHNPNSNPNTNSASTQRAYVASTSSPMDYQWLLDSGATNHITNDPSQISLNKSVSGGEQVSVGNGSRLDIEQMGDGILPTPSRNFRLNNILYVPSITHNLLSIHKFAIDNYCSLTFDSFGFYIQDKATNNIILSGPCKDGLYPVSQSITTSRLAFSTQRLSSTIWHNRLGHPSHRIFTKLVSSYNLPVTKSTLVKCDHCQVGKSHKLPFSNSTSHSSTPLELLHMDVWGPSPLPSHKGYRYYLLIIDDYSRFAWLYPMFLKSDVFSTFVNFVSQAENQFNQKVKMIRSDNGGEFINHKMSQFLLPKGIVHQTSCPHTPEQNGIVERKHRHLIETTVTLLHQARMPSTYWLDALTTSLFLINRLPSKLLNYFSPYELIFQNPPDYFFLKTFGCKCFPWLRPYSENKLSPRSRVCVFLGYCYNTKGYKCLDLQTDTVFISRHVTFEEDVFPFATYKPPTTTTSTNESVPRRTIFVDDESHSSPPPFDLQIQPNSPTQPNSHSPQPTPDNYPTTTLDNYPLPSPISNSTSNSPSPSSSHLSSPNPSHQHDTINTHPMVTRSKSGITKTKTPISLVTQTSTPSLINETEPPNFTVAVKNPKWRSAMSDEYHSLMQQRTWSLVDPPPNCNIIGCRWVFRIKRHSDGSLARYKARLVAKGFHQTAGVDFYDTFSPVVKQPTIRIVLSLAVNLNWSIRQLDVSNAFLHGVLEEAVYMYQPQGFKDPTRPNAVCKLHKSLYGLKQAPRAWNSMLTAFLVNNHFIQSVADPSLFTNKTAATMTVILVYVDDILITGNNQTYIDSFVLKMSRTFSIKDLGALHQFLGIEFTRTSNCITLSQKTYAQDILNKAAMGNCKPCATPTASKPLSSVDNDSEFSDPHLYRSLVGSLQYLTITHPEISFAVNTACQYLQKPLNCHFSFVKRLLRYIQGHLDFGLQFHKGPLEITAYSDADWAGDLSTRRSTSGLCVFFGSNLIAWVSRKQQTVARSSTEAEYRALATAAVEIIWIQSILSDLGIPLKQPPVLWCDNISAISLASNPVFHARTKHIEVDYHFVREKVVNNQLQVRYVSTIDQTADIFTKSLSTARFRYLRDKLMVISATNSLRGRISGI